MSIYQNSFLKQPPKPPYVYGRSFTAPIEKREYEDGRDKLDASLRKMFAAGPQAADALAKYDRPAIADYKSVKNIKKALRHPHGIGAAAHRQVDINAIEPPNLRKTLAAAYMRGYALTVGDDLRKTAGAEAYARGFALGARDTRALRKAPGKPRRLDPVTDNYGHGAPESSNSTWTDTHADTGATNDWHDQIVPTTKPKRIVFPQFGRPGDPSRDDAIEAIKEALSKPLRWGGRENEDRNERAKDTQRDDAAD